MCNKTSAVGDITIPKGAMVDIPIYMLHHLPDYWDEPEEFIPERLAQTNAVLVLIMFSKQVAVLHSHCGLLENRDIHFNVYTDPKMFDNPDTSIIRTSFVGCQGCGLEGLHCSILWKCSLIVLQTTQPDLWNADSMLQWTLYTFHIL